RTKRLPWIVLVPTFALGYAVASAAIPPQHHTILEAIRLLVTPAELAVIVYLITLTRRAFVDSAGSNGDFATRFRSAARKVLGTRIPADILTTEVSILYYAFGWHRSLAKGPATFTVHRKVGYLGVLIGLSMVLFVEMVGVHLLVSLWSVVVAWLLTVLSIYAG